MVLALVDKRGLAAASSGWKTRAMGFCVSVSSMCAMAEEPPSMLTALSTFLTIHGCSTETAVTSGMRYQRAP